MYKCFFFLSVLILSVHEISAQQKTENLVIVTLDGMRWEEVYGGADSALLLNSQFTKDSTGTSSKFWDEDINIRRMGCLSREGKTSEAILFWIIIFLYCRLIQESDRILIWTLILVPLPIE